MQPYAINIDPVAASEFDAAVDAAILAQAASLADAVKAVIANLGEQAKLMAVDLTAPSHIGAYFAGTHASGTENTALREQASIQIYSAPPPPPPAAVDTITQAPAPGAQPGGLLAPTPGGAVVSQSPPFQGGPGDTSAGANPIPTALEPANTVPDGSAPSAGTPPEQVDPNAPSSAGDDEATEPAAAPAPSVPVVITEPAPVVVPPVEPTPAPAPAPDAPAPDAADQAIADAEAADAAEDAAAPTNPSAPAPTAGP